MQSVMQVIGSLVLLFAVAHCKIIDVPVVNKYITTEVMTNHQDESVTLIGHLCGGFQGYAVNVSVMLLNNPEWDLFSGVFRYYIVDGYNKTEASALCTNVKSDGKPGPLCLVNAWPSTGDIYIKGTSGGVEAISFTLDAEFFLPSSSEAALIRSKVTTPKKLSQKLFKHPKLPLKAADDVCLTQFVTLAAVQSIPYKDVALLTTTFCPTPKTGSQYKVRSTVSAVDGRSAYAQYLCSKLPCVVDGPNVIAHNGRQLPSNTVTTTYGHWTNVYVLIVCWGGVYDPVQNKYIGKFVYNAEMII